MNPRAMKVIAYVLLVAIGLFLLSVRWDPINSLWR